jgi:hypothetical protein
MDPEPKPDPEAAGDPGRRRRRVRAPRSGRARRAWRWVARAAVVAVAALAGGAAVWLVIQAGRPVAAVPPEPRLIGTWVSDADATIAELHKSRDVSDAEELDLRRRLFKTVMTFSADSLTTDVNGDVDARPYRVVRRTDDGVILKYRIEASMQEEEVRITFLGPDRIRLDLPQFSLTEFYRRVR